MQSMSDDELDKLFKEAAEGLNAPQDSSAWQDMLRRLDKRPMPSGFWNWKTDLDGCLYRTNWDWHRVVCVRERLWKV
jgi:hypothetical protein